MKKIFSFLLIAFGSLQLSFLHAQERIMVIADPHVMPLSLIGNYDNFDEYMAGQRKMLQLSEPAWLALMDTAMKYRPDLVLIPGDLTKDGEPEAHAMVTNSLNALQEAGIPSLVIPGNHDMPDGGWETLYASTYDHVLKDPGSRSFAAEPLRGLTVLGIDGTQEGPNSGKITKSTLAWILTRADSAAAKGNMIIAMTHWQILEHFDMQGTMESSCRMNNADALRDSLMHHGVRLALTGHFHVNGITTFRDTTGLTNDSLVEISTGSPITYPCPYRWLTISEDRSTVEVSTEDLLALPQEPDLLTYSREWMREHTANLIPVVTLRAWSKVDANWEKIEAKMTAAGLGSYWPMIEAQLPQTDEEKVDLVQRHLGATIVELYLLHSEANEPENPNAQVLVEQLNAGIDDMVDEVLGVYTIILGNIVKPMAKMMMQEPLQSLVEDVTNWSSALYSNRTDDLAPTLVINDPQPVIPDALDTLQDPTDTRKLLRNGQLLILRNGQTYTITGQRL